MPEARKIRFEKGHDIGHLARSIFPNGIDVSPAHPGQYGASAKQTSFLTNQKETVIYEAAFIYNSVMSALDILVYNDGWHAYEVKSSEKISDTYIEDAALQYYVISGSGLVLKDFSIIHLKKHYNDIHTGDPLAELFQFTSVLDHCMARQENINKRIEEIKYILASPSVPPIKMGEQCNNPYDCDFIGWCTKQQNDFKEGLFK